jgi:hypothetical protein
VRDQPSAQPPLGSGQLSLHRPTVSTRAPVCRGGAYAPRPCARATNSAVNSSTGSRKLDAPPDAHMPAVTTGAAPTSPAVVHIPAEVRSASRPSSRGSSSLGCRTAVSAILGNRPAVVPLEPPGVRIVGVRYWLPLLATVVCLVAATMVPPLVAYVLIVAAFALVFDVSTKWFQQTGSGGRLTDHRQ